MRRFVVNIDRARMLMFKGMRWSLDAQPRARGLDAHFLEARIASKDRLPLAALLRVHYHTPWADARDVLTMLRAPPASIAKVHWAVASSEADAWVPSRIEMEPVTKPIEPAAQTEIILEWTQGSIEADAAPVLQIGDDPLTFAAGDPYAAGSANDLANRNWREVAARLKEAKARGTRAAVLSISDRVPWAYVAMTLGTLLDAGIDRIHMAEMDYHLSTPPLRTVPWHAGDRDPRDWHPAVAIGVGVAIAIAVFGLSVWTTRKRRRSSRGGRAQRPRVGPRIGG